MISLRELLSPRPREIVSLVGAGGKTTFMYALAHELAAWGQRVLTTTTTKIWPPSAADSETLWLDAQGFLPQELWRCYRHITCVAAINDQGKAIGVSPQQIGIWHRQQPIDCLIVEADGAHEKPFKAPDIAYEPVVPDATTSYVVIAGIDAIGCPLTQEFIHRPEIVARVSGARLGMPVKAEDMAAVLRYYLTLSPTPRTLVFLNKVANREQRELAEKVIAHLPGVATAFGSLHRCR